MSTAVFSCDVPPGSAINEHLPGAYCYDCYGIEIAGAPIAVTTVVHVHNLLGRLYMLPVTPRHKVIAPAVVARIVEA